MPPQSPETIQLQSTSSKKWSFTILRPLSSSVQLVCTSTSKYALKTLTLRSDEHIQQALDDAEIWRRAHAAHPTNILNLHDIVVDPPNVYYIMEYCPTGDLTTVRNESSALRCLAAVAAALEVVLSDCNQPAHANLSAKNVLLDASGNPKLGGWGVLRSRRLKNPNRSITERDDVRALAAILYEMLYGRRFDVDNLKLPESPQVSRLTADLLRNVLYVRLKDVPELTAFRYDLAAARLLVPACTPALEPIVNRRREENLDIDLNSKRGVEPTSNVPTGPVKSREVPKRPSPPQGAHSHQSEKVQNSTSTTRAVQQQYMAEEQPDGMDINTNSGIDHAVRQMTHGDMQGIRAEELDFLVDSCARIEDLPDKIFKVLFRLPISKNPIVAFKAIAVIHRLISEGPASLTALAITNDGFLNWIESSWSRDRLQNKTGKIHMYSYCFSAGEVSWYTAILRKRIEAHGRFAQVFSTHWVPRPAGLPNIRATRRDAFRLILNVTEKSSSLIRKTASAKDPAAAVKQCAIPVLVAEVWKSYHAICWLYATSEDALKPHLYPELELAHNAAKSAIEAVKSLPHVAESCVPHTIIDLPDQAPRDFDRDALIKSLKRKRKRRKKKPVSSDSNGESSGQPVRDEEVHENGEEQSQTISRNSDTREETARAKTKPKRRKGKKEKLDANVERDKESELSRVQNGAVGVTNIQRQINPQMNTPIVEPNGLHKLSLSVRRGVSRAPPDRDPVAPEAHHTSDDETSLETSRNTSKSKPSRPRSRSRGRKKGRPRRSDDEEEEYDSTEESDDRISETNGASQSKEDLKEKRRRANERRREVSESESESEEERQTRRKSDSKKRKKKKKKKRQMKEAESSEGSSSESDSAQERAKQSQKKTPKPKHTDEKSIPFDKEHPTRRKAAKKPDDEYTGGSKEALAAAAKGKKTPSINPKFEIAPYEVIFGPQIGSGGFGVVYKAKFRNETVAVKKIHGHALSNAASVSEFQAEVAVLCTLSHPNILRFVGACTKPPNLMILTEFMSRGTLFDLLHQSNTRVTWPMRKKFALDTCKGMRYLHDSKLLHRDLKSSNLMIDKDFNCKVGDFGLTRISKGTAAVQMTGQCGTFQYMAVEVLANKPYSEKADVFSFGVLLWEMVARKLPYFGMQPMQVGIAVLQQGLRPTIPPKCPEPLAKLMRACWDSDPNRRPSFAQLMQALEAMPE